MENENRNTRKPIFFGSSVRIEACAAVGGKKEKEGPLGDFLDIYCEVKAVGKNMGKRRERNEPHGAQYAAFQSKMHRR